MPWFKVDDRLHSSRKVLSIPRSMRLPAMGLWVLCGSWVAGEGTDGWVPDYIVEEYGGTPEIVSALLESGLWVSSDKGPTFHSWTEYNPDSETVQAGKTAQSEGAKHANHKRWHVKRRVKVPGCQWCFPSESGADQIPDRSTDGEANPPDPARPDPITTSNEVVLSSSEVADATPRHDVEELLDLLDSEIEANGGRKPTRTKKNRDAIRLMLDRDKIPAEHIAGAIRWCQADEFWRGNILSASKLREKYETLRAQAARRRTQPAGASKAQERQDANLSVIDQLKLVDQAEQGAIEG